MRARFLHGQCSAAQVGLLVLALLAACSRSFSLGGGGALIAVPERTSVGPRGSAVIHVSGGRPGYRATLSGDDRRSGPDAQVVDVDAATFRYTAGSDPNCTDTVRVSDGAGQQAVLSFSVGAGLRVDPTSAQLAPGQTLTLVPSGGEAPYCFTLASTGACPPAAAAPVCTGADAGFCGTSGDGGATPSCVDPTGTFRASSCGDSLETITVTDADGLQADALVRLGPALGLSQSATAVDPGGTVELLAYGGVPPYTYGFAHHGNLSEGQVGPTGRYVAGPNPDALDVVEVGDQAGARIQATIQVGDPSIALPELGYDVLHAGDFDGDRIDDLVALSTTSSTASVALLRGLPGGGHAEPTFTSFAQNPQATWVLDIDGDGRDDVVAGFGEPGGFPLGPLRSLQALLGGADGQLHPGPALTFPAGSHQPSFGPGAVVDLRPLGGSAYVGLEGGVLSGPHEVRLLQVRDGGWTTPQSLPTGESAAGTMLPDTLFAATSAEGTTALLAVRYLPAHTTSPDCPSASRAQLVLLPIQSQGLDGGSPQWAIGEPTCRTIALATGNLVGVTGGDMNGDGRVDLVAWTEGETDLSLAYLPSTAEGSFGPEVDLTFPNLDEDGLVELNPARGGRAEMDVLTSETGTRLLGTDGALTPAPQPFAGGVASLTTGDFDGDGLTDVATLTHTGTVHLLSGSLGQDLRAGRAWHLPEPTILLAAGDVDGDGLPDVTVVEEQAFVFTGTGGGHLALASAALIAGDPNVEVSGPAGVAIVTLDVDAGAALDWVDLTTDGGIPPTPLPISRPELVFPLHAGGAFDGGDLAVAGVDNDVDPGLLTALVRVAADHTATVVSGPRLAGFAVAPGPANAGSRDSLLVLRETAHGTRLDRHDPEGATWSATASASYATTLTDAPQPEALAPLALHPGDPVDCVMTLNLPALSACADRASITVVRTTTSPLALVAQSPAFALTDCDTSFYFQAVTSDLDHDGNTDAILYEGTELFTAWGDGLGHFTIAPLPVGGAVAGVALADLDGDGWDDLLWLRGDLPLLYAALNGHDRTFH